MRFMTLMFGVVGALAMAVDVIAAEGKLGVELVERNGQVVILQVLSGSGAQAIGIQRGDVLLKVGATNINSIQDALNAKAAASNNTDVPFLIGTPNGTWPINARFESGQPYSKYSSSVQRPGGNVARPGGTTTPPSVSPGGNPPRP
ncbi:PDZ domain-containing protein [Lignipirellula cremea]|uniref:PDZ domain (Also known as DHR or GLGF) n=1 Tax=Lignipirellula cremea TaxID=2528010 RepID=A0A518DV55_9BACT|nr:PDZ domain-containing protein [Lignipirellula cremea]QDU95718.1 PDZ domain (Also known as DHR or GLGF) [Lignipirellula cremea]